MEGAICHGKGLAWMRQRRDVPRVSSLVSCWIGQAPFLEVDGVIHSPPAQGGDMWHDRLLDLIGHTHRIGLGLCMRYIRGNGPTCCFCFLFTASLCCAPSPLLSSCR